MILRIPVGWRMTAINDIAPRDRPGWRGGIGFILMLYIRLPCYRAAGIAVWLIAVTVAVPDYVSSEIRQAIRFPVPRMEELCLTLRDI